MSLYMPLCNFPNGEVFDPTIAQTFKWQVQGNTCIAYQFYILNMSNVAVYTGTKIDISSSPLYNGDVLEIAFSANGTGCSVGTDYKHYIKMWDTASHYVTSAEVKCLARTTPTLSINLPTMPHNKHWIDFTLNYTQAESVGIKYFRYDFYDDNLSLLDTSGDIYSAKTNYTFDGMRSSHTYYIRAIVENQLGQRVDTGYQTITISYNPVQMPVTPTVVNDEEHNALLLSWIMKQINGQPSSPTGYEYWLDFIYWGKYGCHIFDGENIIFAEDVPADNWTLHCDYKRFSTHTGVIFRVVDTQARVYELSFDGTKFVYNMNGTTADYTPTTYDGNVFHVVLLPTKAVMTGINTTELFPSDTLFGSDTLFASALTFPT